MSFYLKEKLGLLWVLAIFGCSPMHSKAIAPTHNELNYYEFKMYNIKLNYPKSSKGEKLVAHPTGDNSVDFNLTTDKDNAKGIYTVIIRDAVKIKNKKEFHEIWLPALREYITKDRSSDNSEFTITHEKKLKVNAHNSIFIVATNDTDTFIATAIQFDKFVIVASKYANDSINIDFLAPFILKDNTESEQINPRAQEFYNFTFNISEMK